MTHTKIFYFMEVYRQKAGSLKDSPSGLSSLNALITLSYWNIIFKHPKTHPSYSSEDDNEACFVAPKGFLICLKLCTRSVYDK